MSDDSKPTRHPMLERQLRRLGFDPSLIDPRLAKLLDDVSRTYIDNDENRYLLERSMELSSVEMEDLNAKLAEERKRLAKEFEIAQHLQTSILPQNFMRAADEGAGKMVPATEVGGDYYDLVPSGEGTWIAIGDVAGHGLRSAVVMTMVQSMVSVLVRLQDSAQSPRDVIVAMNRAMHENVFRRLRTRDHVTFTLLHAYEDGRVIYAGAHEVMLVYRAATGTCEHIDTPGTWVGPSRDVTRYTVDRSFQLEPGDLVTLYTDGVTEARNAANEQYGLERLEALIVAHHATPLPELCDLVIADVARWTHVQEDDVTIVLYRRIG